MYTEFFGLDSPPFNSTLDPNFFFAGPQHEEALASMIYTVQEGKGLVVVTGDVGSGKTLLSHLLKHRLGQSAEVACVNQSHLVAADLLHSICREFQLPIDDSFNTMELLAALEEFLLTQRSKSKMAALILDDAQALTTSHFEQLRLVSNLEVANGKLLQIVLLGQRELMSRLQKPSLKQLRQRIFRSAHVTLLSRDLTEKYITFRLQVAGATSTRLFDEHTLDLIHQFSNGVPRLINNLCDNLLISAYSAGVRIINSERANDVIDEMMSAAEASSGPGIDDESADVDHAFSDITSQYVDSLEHQISELESASAGTDQRIQEVHRLSAKLQAQELKINENQVSLDAKIRDLHRLTVTLQEQERSLNVRERTVATRIEEMQSLSERLETQDHKLIEREAVFKQQSRDLGKMTERVGEQIAAVTLQDQRLTERAKLIDQTLANRQVSFDRELNECKRHINHKWEEIRELVTQYEAKESETVKRIASVDQRLRRFDQIRSQLTKQEADIAALSEKTRQELGELDHKYARFIEDGRNYHDDLVKNANATHEHMVSRIKRDQDELLARSRAAQTEAEVAADHLSHFIENATIMLNQPKEIMAKAAQQMEQAGRMTSIVQHSLEAARKVKSEAEDTFQKLQECETGAHGTLKRIANQSAKTHQLRELLGKIYKQANGQVEQLKNLVGDGQKLLAYLPKQLEQLREDTSHPTKLVKELRTIGSVTERNLHDGQVRLGELRTMIGKADRARQSIEAMINATRRIAEIRRPKEQPGQEIISSPITTVSAPRKPDTLTKKIKSLTEAVRKARSDSTDRLHSVQQPEMTQSLTTKK